MSGTADKLVHQANQIAGFFSSQPQSDAAAAAADHMAKFWPPRVREAAYALLDAGGAGLEPAALQAVVQLRRMKPAAS